jgi:hypothetical protein
MQISDLSMFLYIFPRTRKAHSPQNIQVYLLILMQKELHVVTVSVMACAPEPK